jgi:hypothetical protein
MANLGSVTNLKNDSIDEKVTTNGNGENTGVRVNGCLQDIVDTLTGSPVVSNGVPNPLSVYASAAQGLAADSAVQPGDLAAVATSGNYNDLTTLLSVDGVTIIGDGTTGNPLTATFAFGFQGSYDPNGTNFYPTSSDTIDAVPISAGMYWVVSAVGTINGTLNVNPGDGLFALVNNAQDNDDNDWDDFPALYGGLPVLTVTGLDTDNTNPQNPIVQIATGSGLTGLGTPASPLAVGSAPVPAGNLVYVDAINGNDGTGAAGDISTPFLTLAAAQGAAILGDTIMVLPGAYTSTQLGKDGVNWYFMPGATVNFSTTGWTIPVSGSNQSYNVYGFGEFVATGSVIALFSSGDYYFEGVSFGGQAINVANNANTTITAKSINVSNGSSFSGGTSTINCPSIVVASAPLAISSTGNLTINGNLDGRITSGAVLRVNGSVTGFFASSLIVITGGSNVITGNVSNTSTSRAIQHDSGNLTLLGSQISSNGTLSPIQKNGTAGLIRMRDCWIVANAAATEGITTSGTANVYCFNCHTNKPIGAAVNVIGDMKFDSVAEATAGQVATVLADGTWDWASLPPQSVLSGNVAVVDDVNGNDSTGVVGRLDKPFLTLLAAQTAATSGTTIVVYPGAYTSTALGKDNVNWYFMPGANVTFSSGNGFVAGAAISFKVRGYGQFICSLGSARFVFTDNAGANIDIECDTITTNVIRFSNGVARVKANFINIALNVLAFGGTNTIIGDVFSSTGSQIVDHTGGTLLVKDSNMTITTPASPCIKINFGSGVELSNVTLTSTGSSITTASTASVTCRNSFTNQGVGVGVTIVGDLQYDYITGGTVGQVATVNADGTWSWA